MRKNKTGRMTWQTLTIALILLLTKGVSTMAQISNKVCDTIPYEFIHNKIIIPVTVNGMQVKYIVDTGGMTGTMWETAVKMKATAAGYTRVSDVNARSSGYQEAYITNFSIGKGYKVPKLKTMVLPANPFFTGLGCGGYLRMVTLLHNQLSHRLTLTNHGHQLPLSSGTAESNGRRSPT